METQVLYPNTDYYNETISGSGAGYDGMYIDMSGLPTTGSTSCSAYVNEGVGDVGDTSYWSDGYVESFDNITTFITAFDKLAISPQDGFLFNIKTSVDDNYIFSSPRLDDLALYLTKETNPSLAQDEMISSLSSLIFSTSLGPVNNSGYFVFDESKRTILNNLGDDAIISLSGTITYSNATPTYGIVKIYAFELVASGEIIDLGNTGSVNFYMGEPITSCSKLLLPNTDYVSEVIGSGGFGSDGVNLSGLPKTGINSLANYVCEGFDPAIDTTYWGTRTDINDSTLMKYIVTFDDLDIPISGAYLNHRTYYDRLFGFYFSPGFYNMSLYLRQENNPSLSNDIQITDVHPFILDVHPSGYHNSGIYFDINPLGQAAIESLIPNARISVSGEYMFGGNGALGVRARITEMGLCVAAQPVDVTNNIDLYTLSSEQVYNNIDLYTHAGTTTNYFNQVVVGHLVSDSGVNMSLTGHTLVDSGIFFYTSGIDSAEGGINFTLAGKIAYPYESGLTFFTYSATQKTLYKSVDLILGGNEFDPEPEQNINFSLAGPPSVEMADYINFTLNHAATGNKSIDFFLCNNFTESSGQVTFVIQGDGITDGAVPTNGIIPFVIGRDSESLVEHIPFYLRSPEEIHGDIINMTVNGVYTTESGIEFSITGQHFPNQAIKLYTHGF